MGVLACDRNGCKEIMCDRYSDEYGYICNDCFNELRSSPDLMSPAEFMKKPKGWESKKTRSIYEKAIEQIFRKRR